jgi:hypothetical protein
LDGLVIEEFGGAIHGLGHGFFGEMGVFLVGFVVVGKIGVATQKDVLGPVGYKNKESSTWHYTILIGYLIAYQKRIGML